MPENSAEAFCGMFVEEVPAGIILRGAVIDEPHLLGVINQLGVLGLSIVSVHPVTLLGPHPDATGQVAVHDDGRPTPEGAPPQGPDEAAG